MTNKIKLHIQKYIFYDILGILLLIAIVFLIVIYARYKSSKGYEGNFDNLYYDIKRLYEFKPSFFNFDENGVAIIKVDDLLVPITNGNQTMQVLNITHNNKYQDECVGYIIVEKLNDDLKVDTSHICDMIDY